MRTKLIITLNKNLDNSVFTVLWQSKYSTLGELTIESEELSKILYIDNTEAEAIHTEEQPSIEFSTSEKSLSINDYTTELVLTHIGIIKSIETLIVSEKEAEKTQNDS